MSSSRLLCVGEIHTQRVQSFETWIYTCKYPMLSLRSWPCWGAGLCVGLFGPRRKQKGANVLVAVCWAPTLALSWFQVEQLLVEVTAVDASANEPRAQFRGCGTAVLKHVNGPDQPFGYDGGRSGTGVPRAVFFSLVALKASSLELLQSEVRSMEEDSHLQFELKALSTNVQSTSERDLWSSIGFCLVSGFCLIGFAYQNIPFRQNGVILVLNHDGLSPVPHVEKNSQTFTHPNLEQSMQLPTFQKLSQAATRNSFYRAKSRLWVYYPLNILNKVYFFPASSVALSGARSD